MYLYAFTLNWMMYLYLAMLPRPGKSCISENQDLVMYLHSAPSTLLSRARKRF